MTASVRAAARPVPTTTTKAWRSSSSRSTPRRSRCVPRRSGGSSAARRGSPRSRLDERGARTAEEIRPSRGGVRVCTRAVPPAEAVEDPPGVERLAEVRAAVDADEVAVRGSIASRASAGKFRLCRSISSFTSAKLQFSATPARQQRTRRDPRVLGERATPLRADFVLVDGVLDRAQPAHPGRGPPSARTPESASGRKFRSRCRSGVPRTGLDARSASSCSRSRTLLRRLRPRRALTHDLLQRPGIHVCEGTVRLHGGDRGTGQGGGARPRAAGSTTNGARADPPVPGRRAEDGRAPGRGVRRRAAPARRPDEAAHGRRERDRARRDPGRRLAALFVFQIAEDETVALANPEIVERGEETKIEDEGCLSIQGVLLPIERPATIAIQGRTSTARRCGTSWTSHIRGSPSTRRTTSTAS